MIDEDYFVWIKIADSIAWLYLREIISSEERDRLLKESEKIFESNNKEAKE